MRQTAENSYPWVLRTADTLFEWLCGLFPPQHRHYIQHITETLPDQYTIAYQDGHFGSFLGIWALALFDMAIRAPFKLRAPSLITVVCAALIAWMTALPARLVFSAGNTITNVAIGLLQGATGPRRWLRVARLLVLSAGCAWIVGTTLLVSVSTFAPTRAMLESLTIGSREPAATPAHSIATASPQRAVVALPTSAAPTEPPAPTAAQSETTPTLPSPEPAPATATALPTEQPSALPSATATEQPTTQPLVAIVSEPPTTQPLVAVVSEPPTAQPATAAATETAAPSPTPTATDTPVPTATETAAPTATPTDTPSPTATATEVPAPSLTPTEVPPTATPTPPPAPSVAQICRAVQFVPSSISSASYTELKIGISTVAISAADTATHTITIETLGMRVYHNANERAPGVSDTNAAAGLWRVWTEDDSFYYSIEKRTIGTSPVTMTVSYRHGKGISLADDSFRAQYTVDNILCAQSGSFAPLGPLPADEQSQLEITVRGDSDAAASSSQTRVEALPTAEHVQWVEWQVYDANGERLWQWNEYEQRFCLFSGNTSCQQAPPSWWAQLPQGTYTITAIAYVDGKAVEIGSRAVTKSSDAPEAALPSGAAEDGASHTGADEMPS